MKKNKNIIFKDVIKKNHINNKIFLKDKKKAEKNLIYIYKNLNNQRNVFHSFSNKFKINFNKENLKKFQKYKTVIVLGIGGSILGSEAIYSFLKHKIRKKFIFLDNLDLVKIRNIKRNINYKNTLFLIISKSGNTIETLTNLNLLKQNNINSTNTIIITENKKNLLNIFALENQILNIEHRGYIGGRFSVLSEVGLLPATLMNLNVNNLRKNIILNFKLKRKFFLSKSVAKLSQIYSKKKFNTIVLLNYCPELNELLHWCQQLFAESLGKKGKGLIPLVSTAPKDHHSLLQLYLDGPKDKLFYIFTGDSINKTKIKKNIFGKNFNFTKNKKTDAIIQAQKKALIKVLQNKNIPFREFHVNNFNEETIGELFSYFILETVLLGKLLNINPFDQPAVEEVKNLTKNYLT